MNKLAGVEVTSPWDCSWADGTSRDLVIARTDPGAPTTSHTNHPGQSVKKIKD